MISNTLRTLGTLGKVTTPNIKTANLATNAGYAGPNESTSTLAERAYKTFAVVIGAALYGGVGASQAVRHFTKEDKNLTNTPD